MRRSEAAQPLLLFFNGLRAAPASDPKFGMQVYAGLKTKTSAPPFPVAMRRI